jgi:hypothetical protein
MGNPYGRFRQTITFKTLTSVDTYSAPTYGSGTAALARVEPKRKVIRDERGNEILASHVVYTAAAIKMTDRVWFPGESTSDNNKARRPIAIDEYVDGNGLAVYRKVWFG